ncbi:thermonuclease family protein [Virgibacillus salexigens]|uniref:thermonuclease family protein n=1 Tax=Virgibacillus massiliensis TaxID=1462526 RepID=UPI001370A55C|nr:thermonuclease family protein [Virgibacillus massiliensis]MYL43946.1 endonuclease [Virgibacillus massiliensis]
MKKISSFIVLVALFVGLFSSSNTPSDIRNEITSFASILFEDTQATETEEIAINKEKVTVDRVVDGDTVKVEFPSGETETVRLLLIDSPESVHPTKPVQPYGEEASDFAKDTLKEGQTLTLEKGDPERDKYDRLLGYIWVDGKNFNQLMIEEGFARVAYVYEPNTKYVDEFREAEKAAEQESNNIWSIDGYVESQFEDY